MIKNGRQEAIDILRQIADEIELGTTTSFTVSWSDDGVDWEVFHPVKDSNDTKENSK